MTSPNKTETSIGPYAVGGGEEPASALPCLRGRLSRYADHATNPLQRQADHP
jgi:hypothetical protein